MSNLPEDSNLLYINWKCYNDNNNLQYENRGVYSRFITEAERYLTDYEYNEAPLNGRIKTFAKCYKDRTIIFNNAYIQNKKESL